VSTRVEGIAEVHIEDRNRETASLGVFKNTGESLDLAFRAASPARSFLLLCQDAMIFQEAGESVIEYESCDFVCTWQQANGPPRFHVHSISFLLQEANETTMPCLARVPSPQSPIDCVQQKPLEFRRAVFVDLVWYAIFPWRFASGEAPQILLKCVKVYCPVQVGFRSIWDPPAICPDL
jgi:hypothetical protein